MAIRQTESAVVVPSVSAEASYGAGEVIGNKFQIPLACGENGSWLGTVVGIDRASANASMRFHFFRSEPSGYSPTGVAFALADVDDDKYLGYADITTWASAGGSKMVGLSTNPGIALFSESGARHVWGVA